MDSTLYREPRWNRVVVRWSRVLPGAEGKAVVIHGIVNLCHGLGTHTVQARSLFLPIVRQLLEGLNPFVCQCPLGRGCQALRQGRMSGPVAAWSHGGPPG